MDKVDYSAFVPDVHFEQIPIKNLVSNQEYQRNLSVSHIKRVAENFDLYQINPVKISRRNGMNYVINGQHTIEIIAIVSGSRDTPVWCMVYDDMDYEVEADVFANQQKYIKSLAPFEIFNANLEAGNDKQLMMKAVVESHGMFIGKGKAPNSVCAVATLEYIFDKYGFHVLDRTLKLCAGTWEGEPNSLSANILKGIAQLIGTFGDKLNDEIFKEKVGAFSAKVISRNAKERRSGSLGYAEAMLLAYTKKMKFPLRMGDLYAHNHRKLPAYYSEQEMIYDKKQEK